MKRILLTLLLALTCAAAHAYFFKVDGIYYNSLGNGCVEVTYPESTSPYNGTITIPSSVTYNSKTYSVTSIGELAFAVSEGLTSITIPNSVTMIDSNAFLGCSGLTSLTIPNSVTEIGEGAFGGCTGLTGTLTIPNSVTSIGVSAFSGCSGLTSLTIGSSVKTIGSCAFYQCSSLTGALTIPNSVTSIGVSAFSGCTGLTSLTIGNSVTSIGELAFNGCSGLSGTLTIPNSVKEIRESAFYGCSGLTSVVYNAENCTTMGDADGPVFEGCTNIASITVGKSVRLLVANAFKGCSKVSSVTSLNPTPPECDDVSVFRNIDMSSCKLYVPNAGYQSYKAADVWKKFSNIIVMDPVAVKTVTFSPSSLTLYVGDSSDITYTVKPSDATVQALEWTVGDTKIASVKDNNDGTATVKALAAGETTITAKATDGSNVKSSCTVTVKKISGVDDVDAEGIAIVATADGIAVKGAPADSVIDVYTASSVLVYHGYDSLIAIRNHGI